MKKRMNDGLHVRAAEQEISERYATVACRADGAPRSFSREARSVDVIATTEDPVPVYDYELGAVVPEILLMTGCKLAKSRQVPLQDSHDRWSVASTLGSARDMHVVDDRIECTVVFSSVPEGESALTKVEEGHLTDFSVGWRELKCVKLRTGEKKTIGGREFEGPARVVTSWTIKELSIVPIGADERAKARAEKNTPTEDTMDVRLRALLELRGLAAGATEEEAQAFLVSLGLKADVIYEDALSFFRADNQRQTGPAGPAQAVSVVDLTSAVSDAMRAAQAAEAQRQNGIREMCRGFDCDDLSASLIDRGVPLDAARGELLEHIRKTANSRGLQVPAGAISFGADSRDKYRDAVSYSLIKRAGIKVPDLQAAPGHEDFTGYTLKELARHSLIMAGRPAGGNVMEMVGRALTTGDLPAILANVANKSLFAGFMETEETFEAWTGVMSAPDFKALNIPSISSLDDLLAIGDHGEYQLGYFRDKQERITLGTAGRIYPITRTALINDDLAAITGLFAGAGKKAKQYEGDLVYAILTANPLMVEDGLNLFVAGHNNLATVVGNPSAATLDDADALMSNQVDANGRRLNIPLSFAIMPRALKGTGDSFFATIEYINAAGDRLSNTWGGNRIGHIYEARLNAAPAVWYGAGPKGTTVVRVYLNGIQTPYLEQKDGWTVDGVELKVRYDVAAGLVDWRGLVRNP